MSSPPTGNARREHLIRVALFDVQARIYEADAHLRRLEIDRQRIADEVNAMVELRKQLRDKHTSVLAEIEAESRVEDGK